MDNLKLEGFELVIVPLEDDNEVSTSARAFDEVLGDRGLEVEAEVREAVEARGGDEEVLQVADCGQTGASPRVACRFHNQCCTCK